MLPLAALAGGISAGFQLYSGLKQLRQASQINPGARPTYATPEAVKQATGIAQNNANSAMPGFGQAIARLGANTASTIKAAQETGSPNNALAVIAAAGDSQNNATNSLATQNAQFMRQGSMALMGQLNTVGQYQDKEWQLNKQKPYEDAVAAKAALTQAGNTNLAGGLTGVGASATQAERSINTDRGTIGAIDPLPIRQAQIDSGLSGWRMPQPKW